jgi:hypothetical protein
MRAVEYRRRRDPQFVLLSTSLRGAIGTFCGRNERRQSSPFGIGQNQLDNVPLLYARTRRKILGAAALGCSGFLPEQAS